MHQDVIAKGTLLCTQAAIPEMQKSGERGKVGNIASIAGLAGWQLLTSYSTAKFSVVGMTKALAPEFAAQNININAICPGLQTDTAIGYECAAGFGRCVGITVDEVIRMFIANMPQGKMGTVEAIARAAAFLASPD